CSDGLFEGTHLRPDSVSGGFHCGKGFRASSFLFSIKLGPPYPKAEKISSYARKPPQIDTPQGAGYCLDVTINDNGAARLLFAESHADRQGFVAIASPR